MTTKLKEHAAWLEQDPDDAEGVVFRPKIRMKKSQVEAGLIEMAALGADWAPGGGLTAAEACNKAVIGFSNDAVMRAKRKMLEQEKAAELEAFRAMVQGG